MSDAPSPLDRLRSLIAADEPLQSQLAQLEDREQFAEAASTLAGDHGITLSPAEILDAARPDPLNVEQYDDRPPNSTGWPGRGWLPVSVSPSSAGLVVGWNHFGAERLDRPFFEDSLRTSNRLPLNRLMKLRTPIATLLELSPGDAATAPDALIFHMSRCGSTLVSQMLAAIPGNVMVSEPAPLDAMVQLLHTHPQVPLKERVGLLRGIAAALGRDRLGDRRHFVIKTDSWHTLALPLFRAAFPDTPWIFLFREPIDVMVSQMRARGLQTVPGIFPDDLYNIPDPLGMSAENYVASVLAKVNGAAVEHRALGGGLFVDYAELPKAVEERILPHFGMTPTADELAAMGAATKRDAKTPVTTFVSDTAQKRSDASATVRAASAAHLDPIHHRLTALAKAG